MRLINTSTLELHDFSLSTIPPYAILSHTWGPEEVSFQDMSSPNRFSKQGYAKIMNTCRLASSHMLEYAWVDTCCIDKSSSAELTETINSMFQWYKNAAICYVFLEDLLPNTSPEVGLPSCRWFSRGWTLQELLAPSVVSFYDMLWNYRGSKLGFASTIVRCTKIPIRILEGTSTLAECSVAMRMAWAAHRKTTRAEDTAYCLLGIFDIHMPLIYGEGLRAFRRLQEEIVKRYNDLTIFAWNVPQDSNRQFLGLFATSPTAFANSSSIMRSEDVFSDFSVTNLGLFASSDLPLLRVVVDQEEGDYECCRYLLPTGVHVRVPVPGFLEKVGIYLRKIGPRLFYRDATLPLAGFGMSEIVYGETLETNDYYILVDPTIVSLRSLPGFRQHMIHVPFNVVFALQFVAPKTLWDVTDRVFLREKLYSYRFFHMVLALMFTGTIAGRQIGLAVLCDHRAAPPTSKVFLLSDYPRQSDMIFDRDESRMWLDLELQAPELIRLGNFVDIATNEGIVRISVSFDRGLAKSISSTDKVYSLELNITRRLGRPGTFEEEL